VLANASKEIEARSVSARA